MPGPEEFDPLAENTPETLLVSNRSVYDLAQFIILEQPKFLYVIRPEPEEYWSRAKEEFKAYNAQHDIEPAYEQKLRWYVLGSRLAQQECRERLGDENYKLVVPNKFRVLISDESWPYLAPYYASDSYELM